MSCDCSRLAYGALLVLPLECKTILGPFNRGFVLTDVIFDLSNHPNGANSKACGFVWNALPNQWSRLLLGGTVMDEGRKYDLESGILCPRGSYLSICSCLFVAEPTAQLSARVTGCFCEREHHFEVRPEQVPEATWDDGLAPADLDPIDPTSSRAAEDRATSFTTREVLATSTELVPPGDLLVRGPEAAYAVPPGHAVAVPVSRNTWRWAAGGERERVARAPSGTNLVVGRRSVDGRLVHWAMYREAPLSAGGRARR